MLIHCWPWSGLSSGRLDLLDSISQRASGVCEILCYFLFLTLATDRGEGKAVLPVNMVKITCPCGGRFDMKCILELLQNLSYVLFTCGAILIHATKYRMTIIVYIIASEQYANISSKIEIFAHDSLFSRATVQTPVANHVQYSLDLCDQGQHEGVCVARCFDLWLSQNNVPGLFGFLCLEPQTYL